MDEDPPEYQEHLRQRRALLERAKSARTEKEFRRLWDEHREDLAVRSALGLNSHAPAWVHQELFGGGWFDHMTLTDQRAYPPIEMLRALAMLTFTDLKQRRGYRNEGDIENLRTRIRSVLMRRGAPLPQQKEEENDSAEKTEA